MFGYFVCKVRIEVNFASMLQFGQWADGKFWPNSRTSINPTHVSDNSPSLFLSCFGENILNKLRYEQVSYMSIQ